jgi:antitoxin (DNA-binding transcriptional repressor) of toxin-antitoxin stability system
MTSISIQEAQARLPALIAELKPGEEVLITKNERTVARLLAEPAKGRKPRKPGSAVGQLTILAEDDAHLEDFKEYMP